MRLLLSVGNGTTPTPFVVPPSMLAPTNSSGDLLATVFDYLTQLDQSTSLRAEFFLHRAILTPKNATVNEINDLAIARLSGESRTYRSADTLPDTTGALAATYPTEFLNSLNPNGLTQHALVLKVGAPVMLLRNLNAAMGLANGTRLIVTSLNSHTVQVGFTFNHNYYLFFLHLQATVLTGTNVGEQVIIPRIPLFSNDTRLPFKMTRRQFPLRLAFAMTINKSQGQTLKKIGVYLPEPCFSHGQLYVALSRVGDPEGITVMLPTPNNVQTQNIVYQEVLN